MGERSKQTVLQSTHTDGQRALENMLNITNYQRNANQNYNEVTLQVGQKGHHQKNLQTIKAEESVVKRECSYTVSGNINLYSHSGEQYGGSLKKN